MTLLDAPQMATLRVLSIDGGQRVRQQLREQGILPGITLRVVRRAPLGGPLLVEAGGTVIALGRGVATKIVVEVTDAHRPDRAA
jgi:ferrous iron transport protein A